MKALGAFNGWRPWKLIWFRYFVIFNLLLWKLQRRDTICEKKLSARAPRNWCQLPFLLGYFITYPDGDISHPQIHERSWELNPFNFDDVTNGLLTLFTVATFEGQFQFQWFDEWIAYLVHHRHFWRSVSILTMWQVDCLPCSPLLLLKVSFNFNDVTSGLLPLFTVATFEG